MTFSKKQIFFLSFPPIYGFFVSIASITISWLLTSSYGNRVLSDISILFFLLMMLTAIAYLLIFLTMFFSGKFKMALLTFLSLVIGLGFMFFLMPFAGKVRMIGFEKLAERSIPLVQAIKKYEEFHGYPPQQLEDIIPAYLAKIPSTGMRAYPDYKYVSGSEALKWNENPWVLYVDCPLGILNWDMFVYFPKQNYPRLGYGGMLRPIKDWA